ncbi:MAG: type I-E CRISPR-associated protein Cas7/Cse4/CasC [Desulfobacteraceae bacterium]|nr:type I-E CRISPR-associated protein Cas7/Cse4/CasC [Desulfobacteraceae bacterium]
MKTFVEIHALQNFAPSNLNRDDTGAPKDALFGGTRRARVSSQCLKRSIRQHFVQKTKEQIFQDSELADRTKRLVGELKKKLAERGRQGHDVDTKIEAALSSMRLKLKGEKTEYLMFLGRSEIANLVNLIDTKWNEIGDPPSRVSAIKTALKSGIPQDENSETKLNLILQTLKLSGDKLSIKEEEIVAIEANLDGILDVITQYFDQKQPVNAEIAGTEKGKKRKKSEMAEWENKIQEIVKEGKEGISALGRALLNVLDGGKAVDVALFGRMLANMPEKNQYAACQVAHAISTHAVEREFDFYTAVDDLKPEDTAGADMMGTIEFNSACFYRYAVVDWEKLISNLQADKELAAKGLRAFLEGFVVAEPTGKQNTFAAHNPPEFVAISIRRNGAPRNLANAFETAIRAKKDESLTKKSAEELIKKAKALNAAFGGEGVIWALNLVGVDTDGFGTEVTSLTELLDHSMAKLKE